MRQNDRAIHAATPFALTIAGSDSGGGAGVQADLKAFASLGVFGVSAITAVTAQNSQAVTHVHTVPADVVAAQIHAILHDFPVKTAKTGMLANAAIVQIVAQALPESVQLVVDPVMIATSGAKLLDDSAIQSYRRLIQRAVLLTPNWPEAEALLGRAIENEQDALDAAHQLLALGPHAVLLKGGHSPDHWICDVLVTAKQTRQFRNRRLSIKGHGTGCTLAALITAGLARAQPLEDACSHAISLVHKHLKDARPIGQAGVSTPDPFWGRYRAGR